MSPSITGPSTICTSGNYTLTNLPTGATVTWSATGALSISGSNTANPVTVAQSSMGTGVLTATVTTACGSFMIDKNILQVGMAPIEGIFYRPNFTTEDFSNLWNLYYTCPGYSRLHVFQPSYPPGTTVSLVKIHGSGSFTVSPTNPWIFNIQIGHNQTARYQVTISSPSCGDRSYAFNISTVDYSCF